MFVYLYISEVIYILSHFELPPSKYSLNSSEVAYKFLECLSLSFTLIILNFSKRLKKKVPGSSAAASYVQR